jgi:hypothetical protein
LKTIFFVWHVPATKYQMFIVNSTTDFLAFGHDKTGIIEVFVPDRLCKLSSESFIAL